MSSQSTRSLISDEDCGRDAITVRFMSSVKRLERTRSAGCVMSFVTKFVRFKNEMPKVSNSFGEISDYYECIENRFCCEFACSNRKSSTHKQGRGLGEIPVLTDIESRHYLDDSFMTVVERVRPSCATTRWIQEIKATYGDQFLVLAPFEEQIPGDHGSQLRPSGDRHVGHHLGHVGLQFVHCRRCGRRGCTEEEKKQRSEAAAKEPKRRSGRPFRTRLGRLVKGQRIFAPSRRPLVIFFRL